LLLEQTMLIRLPPVNSGFVHSQSILSWADFVAAGTLIARRLRVLGLKMILHPLLVLPTCVATKVAHKRPVLSPRKVVIACH